MNLEELKKEATTKLYDELAGGKGEYLKVIEEFLDRAYKLGQEDYTCDECGFTPKEANKDI